MIWLQLHRIVFDIPHDIFICVCYCIPSNSSRVGMVTEDLLDRISLDMAEIINRNGDETYFLVCGDMNARTRTLPDYVENDHSKHVPVPDDYVEDVIPEPRHNMDKTINTQSRHFIEFCKQSIVRILNGRDGADKGLGKLTCIKHNGSSTVDYVTCSGGLSNRIESLRVGEQDKLSDHCWIKFGINVGLIRANIIKP